MVLPYVAKPRPRGRVAEDRPAKRTGIIVALGPPKIGLYPIWAGPPLE
jgi:hypothetical protein